MLLTYFISANYDKLRLQGRVSLCNLLADIEGKINIDLFLLVSNFKEPAFLWFCLFYALLSWYSSEILCKIPINSLASFFFKKLSSSGYFLKVREFNNLCKLNDCWRQAALRFSKTVFVNKQPLNSQVNIWKIISCLQMLNVCSFCLYRYHLCRSAVKSSYVNLDSRTNEEVKTHTKYICKVSLHFNLQCTYFSS